MKSAGINPFQTAAASQALPASDDSLGRASAPVSPRRAAAAAASSPLRRAGRRTQSNRLDQLPPELLTRIAGEFDYGSPSVTRLASTSRSMQSVLGERVLADRLIASVHTPAPVESISRQLCEIIGKAAALPSALRVEVLCSIPTKLISYLWKPTPGFERVFDELSNALVELDTPAQQYRLLHVIGSEFADPDLRDHCLQHASHGQKMMEVVFLKLSVAGERLLTLSTAAICASGPVDASPSGLEKKSRLFSETRSMLARGLYMLPDPAGRSRAWNMLREDASCGHGPQRQRLLEGLTDALPDLSGDTIRRVAFSQLLAEVQQWPDPQRTDMLMRLGMQIPHFTTADGIDHAFAAVLAAALRLKSGGTAEVLTSLCECVDQVPLIKAKAIFDGILDQLPRIDSNGGATVLAALAEQIRNVPSEEDRLEAFDAAWTARRHVDLAGLAGQTVVENLTVALGVLPCDDRRQVRFSRLTDCVMTQPDAQRDDLIEHLASIIWIFEGRALKLSACHDVLGLTAERPPASQVNLLMLLIDEVNSQQFDDTRFAMLAAVERATRKLPPQMQVELLGEAAEAAVWLNSPFMEDRFAALVTAALALPQPHADMTLNRIDRALMVGVAELARAGADGFPSYFEAIVNTCKVVPQAMHVRILGAVIDTSKAYPQEHAQQARDLIFPRLQELPVHIAQPLYQRLNG